MFKKLFSHKKSSRCEICKKKIKNVDKNTIEKQCKECKERNCVQFISPVLIPLNNDNNSVKEIKKEKLCHGCNWPIISEKTTFEDLNNNVIWHNSCFEINKILGMTIPIEPYDNLKNNNSKELRKSWTKCTVKLSKTLIAYLCDCDYCAFEIVSCIKSKDFNSSTLKELIINIAHLLNFLIFESIKFNEGLEKNNIDIEQNELIELFINIIIFSKSIEKDIIYTLNVKKLVRYLSQIHEIIKKELSNNLNSLAKTCLLSEFNNIFKYISEFENFGYKTINSITPIYKYSGVDKKLNIDWLSEDYNEGVESSIISSNTCDTLIKDNIIEKIHNEKEYLKLNSEIIKLIYLLKEKRSVKINDNNNTINEEDEDREINEENSNSITEVNNESKHTSTNSISVSSKTLYDNGNENVKNKRKESISNDETKMKNQNDTQTITDTNVTNNIEKIYSTNDVKYNNKAIEKNYDLIKSSVDNILSKNKHSFTNNTINNNLNVGNSNIDISNSDDVENNEKYIKKTNKKSDENNSTCSTIKGKDINNKNYELLHLSGTQKKKQELNGTRDKNGLNMNLKSNKENNNISLLQYNIRNLEDEKLNLKTEKSSSLYHKYDIENDNENSEYARSFYSLNNLKNYYKTPSSSYSTVNNSEIFDRASSPTYSMGKLEYSNRNRKSTDLSLDNQSYTAYQYKDNYPFASSISSYSPKINGINPINSNNESSDTNNYNANLSSLSVTSNSSVDVIKALSSSLKKGYFSSEAYLKYCKNNQSQNKNQIKDAKFNNSNYIKSSRKNRSYSNNSGINSEWSYEDENFENITTPIKLLNLQFQHEMKKAEDIVDESFERGSVYSQSVDGNIENIKNSLLKIRSIFNNSNSSLSTNSNINLNDVNNPYNNSINNNKIMNMNKLNNSKNQSSLNINNKSGKTINLSQDLIYINKKLNEYNNQKKKHFSDKASISSEPTYIYHDINSKSIISSNSLNSYDGKSQIIGDKDINNINTNLTLLSHNSSLKSKSIKNIIPEEKSSSKKSINDKIVNNNTNKLSQTVIIDKNKNTENKIKNLSMSNSIVNSSNNNIITENKNLKNLNSNTSSITKINNSNKTTINNNINNNSNISSTSNIKSYANSNSISNTINKTGVSVNNNNNIIKDKSNNLINTINTNTKTSHSNNDDVIYKNNNNNKNINNNGQQNIVNNNSNNINNRENQVELINSTNKKQTIVDNKNKNINKSLINIPKKSDSQKDNSSTNASKEVTPKGILSSIPTNNNKKSSLILPSKEELKIKYKDDECKYI